MKFISRCFIFILLLSIICTVPISAAILPAVSGNTLYVLPTDLEQSNITWDYNGRGKISNMYPINTTELTAFGTYASHSYANGSASTEHYGSQVAIMYSDSFNISAYDRVTWYSAQSTTDGSSLRHYGSYSMNYLYLIKEDDTVSLSSRGTVYTNFAVTDANGNAVSRPVIGTEGAIDIKQYRESNDIQGNEKYKFCFALSVYSYNQTNYSNGTVSGPYKFYAYISPAIVVNNYPVISNLPSTTSVSYNVDNAIALYFSLSIQFY